MKFLQPSLSGGELTPGMYGRVDLVRHSISLGLCRNVITKPTGGAAKRPGTFFRGYVKYNDRFTRFIPFIYSTSVRYLIEAGDFYFRFWVDGGLLTNADKAVTGLTASNLDQGLVIINSPAHGFSTGDSVLLSGLVGPDKLNGRSFTITVTDANTFQVQAGNTGGMGAYVSGGTASRIVEVATPYSASAVATIRYTQSADVLYMVQGDTSPKELRRTSINSFVIVDFAFARGPFRPINSNDAYRMAASASQGQVNVTANLDVFTENMVGSLIYMEEQELRGVKPWTAGEKNPAVGVLRRSDSKVYRLSSRPILGGGAGTPYWITGPNKPTHDSGRAFDGPQDVKNDNVNDYAVGVEWEFLHNTFGTLRVTEFVNTKQVKATVIERLPDSVTGVAPVPGNTWNHTGDGSTVTFPIAGAISVSNGSYSVTIDGSPIQSNPNYGDGTDEPWCVDWDSVLPDARLVRDLAVGDMVLCWHPKEGVKEYPVRWIGFGEENSYRVVTQDAVIEQSQTTPMIARDGRTLRTPQLLGEDVLVRFEDGRLEWQEVIELQTIGERAVVKVDLGNRVYFAGVHEGATIATHNREVKP